MAVKNIALLLGDVRDVYSNAVSKGAMQAAMENDCNLRFSACLKVRIKRCIRLNRRTVPAAEGEICRRDKNVKRLFP